MTAGDDFIWIGPTIGDWSTASNWDDLTTGDDPATIAPGITDQVTFDSGIDVVQTIDGEGASSTLTLDGDNAVQGTLTTGSLLVGGALEFAAGATVIADAATLEDGGSIELSGIGAMLQVLGTMAIGADGAPRPTFLEATGGALVQIGDLWIGGNDATLAVDGSSAIEIGPDDAPVAGCITVDHGATLADGGQAFTGNFIEGTVVDDGLILVTGSVAFSGGGLSGTGEIDVARGGSALLQEDVTGSLAIRLESGAEVIVPQFATLGSTVGVTLAGTDDIIQIGTAFGFGVDGLGVIAGTISGFGTSDVLVTDDSSLPIMSAVCAAGTLSLMDGSNVVGTLRLAGDYTGATFVVQPLSSTRAEIFIASPISGSISAGTPTPDDYLWIGPLDGDWDAAANWEDLTTGSSPATIAPGIHDQVTFDGNTDLLQLVEGRGRSSSLTLNGDNAIRGTFTTGTLSVGSGGVTYAQLDVDAGDTLIADTATFGNDDTIEVSGTGALLRVLGNTALALGNAAATDGARVQFGALSIGDRYSGLTVDDQSVIEVGTVDAAAAGVLTIDPGATLTASGTVAGGTYLDGTIVDDGVILATGSLQLNGLLFGDGQVHVASGGTVAFLSALGDGTVDLDSRVEIIVGGALDNAGGVTLAGTGDVIQLGDLYGSGPIGAVGGTIGGFGTSDLLLTGGAAVTNVVFANGTLSLRDGSLSVAALFLAGDYTGDTFVADPVSGTVTEIFVTAPATGSAGTGTPTPDQYVWTGPLVGDWSAAPNWTDTTTGTDPATIAPGLNDQVTFDSSTFLTQIIEGEGQSDTLALNGDNTVEGTLTTGSLSVGSSGSISGVFQVLAGSTLLADTATVQNGYAVAIAGSGAVLQVLGNTTIDVGSTDPRGSFSVTGGARVQVGDLAIGGLGETLSVDGASILEVGTLGGAAAGTLTVDPGATLGAATIGFAPNVIDGAVADDGLITAAGSLDFFGGLLSGSGEVDVTSGGAVVLGADVGDDLAIRLESNAALTIGTFKTIGLGGVTLAGGNDIIQLGTGFGTASGTTGDYGLGTIEGTITGFDTSDVIVANGTEVSAATFADGTLTLSHYGIDVGTLALAGDYSRDTFTVTQLGVFQAEITESVACYCRGTHILTPSGEIPIERLRIGDQVVTVSGLARPIRWIGWRSYGGRFATRNPEVMPVLIRPGALASGIPRRDLMVSPLHAIHIEGLLIPAGRLVNGLSIVQLTDVERVEYFHIELDTHDVILAEGAASETFVDDDSRAVFHNAADFYSLYPEARNGPTRYCAPREAEGFAVDALRRRLAARAGCDAAAPAMKLRGFIEHAGPDIVGGWAQNPDSPEVPVCLDIILDGRVVVQTLANHFRPDLAAAALGSGYHGFAVALPDGSASVGSIEVRRAADQALLARTRACRLAA